MPWMITLVRFGNRAAMLLGLYSVQTPGPRSGAVVSTGLSTDTGP